MQKDFCSDDIYSPLQRWLEEMPHAEHWHSMKRALPPSFSDNVVQRHVSRQSDGQLIHDTQGEKNAKQINDARKK
jgi:hypothetical protein